MGCGEISEIKQKGVRNGVRNVIRPTTVRLRSNPRQRNGENLCRPHPKARAKLNPDHGPASIAFEFEPWGLRRNLFVLDRSLKCNGEGVEAAEDVAAAPAELFARDCQTQSGRAL